MTTVTAITHKDVKGKELLYLKIQNGEHNVLVNVGKKTYDSVKALDAVQELTPLEPQKIIPHGKK